MKDLELDVGLVILLLIAVLIFFAGFSFGSNSAYRDAVLNGVAEWVVVDEYGNTEFQWKTECREVEDPN